MMRKKSVEVRQRNALILSMIKKIETEHPFWGYRRCWAYLYYIERVSKSIRSVSIDLSQSYLEYGSNIKISSGAGTILAIVLDWFTKGIIIYCPNLQSKGKSFLLSDNG